MPAKVRKRNGKFRVINGNTGNIEKNRAGTSVDGGGHATKAGAQRQANAINANSGRRRR